MMDIPSNVEVINNIQLEPRRNGCWNRNACSSMLFILPILYSYLLFPYTNIMFGSLACLITSVLYHYHRGENKLFHLLDRVTVNSIALYFIIDCIINYNNTVYAKHMYLCVVVALCLHYYINYHNPELFTKWHCLVHISAVTGIMFYIKARQSNVLTMPNSVEAFLPIAAAVDVSLCQVTRD